MAHARRKFVKAHLHALIIILLNARLNPLPWLGKINYSEANTHGAHAFKAGLRIL